MLVLPFTRNITKEILDEVKDIIDTPEKTILVGNDILRGITKTKDWDPSQKIKLHVFYNAALAYLKRDELYGYISKLKTIVLTGQNIKAYSLDIARYLEINDSSRSKTGLKVTIRHEIIEETLSHKGFMFAISNFISKADEAIKIYKDKDVVEKALHRIKQFIDLKRLHVHSDTAKDNKLFVCFIASILISHFHTVMLKNDYYKT